MKERLVVSFVILALLFSTFATPYSLHGLAAGHGSPNGAPGVTSGQVERNPGLGSTSTTTQTFTQTVTASTTTCTGVVLDVHVVNQFGVWWQGAVVDVYNSSPYGLVANGTTVNGAFVYACALMDTTYTVNVYTASGGNSSQTVTLANQGQSLNFVIPEPLPPSMALLNVTVVSNSQGGALNLDADVVNTSNFTAYGAFLTISPPPQFALLNTGSIIPVGTLPGGASKAINLEMSVSSSVVTVGYTIGYLVNFTDYSGTPYSSSGSVSLPTPPAPSLVVQNVVLNPSIIQPGTFFSLSAVVMNTSNSTAYNAAMSITPPADFSLLNMGSLIPLGTLIPGGSKQITLQMTVSSAATTSGYTVGFTTTYSDYFLNSFTGTGNLFVPITGNAVHPNIVITSASFSSQSIHPGDTFSVPLSFQNIGTAPANEVILSVNTTSPVAIVGSAGDYRLGSIGGNGNASLSLKFVSPSSAALGAYPIILTITFLDSYGAIYENKQELVVNLIGEPSLVFNSLLFKNNPLTPGLQTFLQAQLVNVGGDNALNVKISFQGGPAFLSNTTMFLGSIAPNGSGNGTAYLLVPDSIPVGDYAFSAVVTYSDLSGNNYTAVSPYSVTVAPFSPPQVTITNTLLSPEVLGSGAQGTFTIYLKNNGANAANNVTVSLNDGGKIFSSSLFGLGTLDAFTSGTTVVGVNVSPSLKAGQYLVQMVVTYYDSNGNVYNSTTPIEITIYGSSSLLSTTDVGIAGGVVIVGAAVFIYLKKPRFGFG